MIAFAALDPWAANDFAAGRQRGRVNRGLAE
jgi:hypothetical protein